LLQGRYRIVRFLGKGGFAKTFEVDDGGTAKVLKVLSNNDPKAVSLFQQEAKVLSQLRHPGIPRVDPKGYFTFEPKDSSEPLHCLVMEKIEGVNLLELLRKRSYKPISQAQAIAWLKQLTIILDQVHQQQYFHRDIKPTNIMLRTPSISSSQLGNKRDQLVLIDFGTAREVTSTYLARIGGGHQVTGLVSAGYTPPEQADGRAVPQSDFYALGRRFVHLLTGRPPNSFAEDSQGNLLWRNGAKHVSKPLADLINYLMAPLPGNRPQDTKEILNCIEKVESHFKSPASQSIRIQTTTPTVRVNSQTAQDISPKNSPLRMSWRRITVLILSGSILLSLSDIIFSSSVLFWQLGRWRSQLSGSILRFWNCHSKAKAPLLHTFCGHSSSVELIALSPNSQTLVSADQDRTIKLWNLQTGKHLRTLTGHLKPIRSIVISRDGKTIATASWDGTIKLWNLPTGELRSTIAAEYSGGVNSIAISPDSQTIGSISFGIPNNFPEQEDLKDKIKSYRSVHSYFYDSRLDYSIKLWNLQTGKRKDIIFPQGQSWFKSMIISPDSQTLACLDENGSIQLQNLQTGKLKSIIPESQTRVLPTSSSIIIPIQRSAKFSSIAISSDSQTLASVQTFAGFDPLGLNASDPADTIKLWDLQTGELKGALTGHSFETKSPVSSQEFTLPPYLPETRSIAISPDSRTLIRVGKDTIDLWNLRTRELRSNLTGHGKGVSSIAISSDSQILVSVSGDGTIKLWNLGTGELRTSITKYSSRVNFIAISPDSRTLASVGGASFQAAKTIELWNLQTGELRRTLSGHVSAVTSIAFSPDSKTLVSSSFDGTMKVWRVP
jgi:WD40 repeat protein